jgi:sulfur carrier protein
MITVNGENRDLPGTPSLAAFLKAQGYALERVVVELNRTAVPKKDYVDIRIRDGDALEIVNFVSGG